MIGQESPLDHSFSSRRTGVEGVFKAVAKPLAPALYCFDCIQYVRWFAVVAR